MAADKTERRERDGGKEGGREGGEKEEPGPRYYTPQC